jgi:hypothetical protein
MSDSGVSPFPISNTLIYSKSQNNFYSSKPVKIPSIEEIARLSDGLVHSKKACPETFPAPPAVRSEREIKLPRIQLISSQKGINKPLWYPEHSEIPQDHGSSRFSSRPTQFLDSSKKIFPTLSLKFHQIPTTTCERFTEINPKQDQKLANYVVNSSNAFRTEWIKNKDLKDRKFYPEKHPEFTGISKENNMRRDKIVEYREAMLKVKAMMNQAWGVKK